MTPTTVSARPALENRAETMFDSLRSYARPALFVLLGAALVAGGVAVYNRSKATNAARADQALFEVQRSLGSGNAALATADLRKLVTRYDGTPSAVQGSMLLAQLLYDQGKADEGLKLLRDLQGERAARDYRAPIASLIAAGLEQQGKPAEAAREYERAAEQARFEVDRSNYRADAARAYMMAGNKDAARRIWSELSAQPAGPVAAEARVRLGELTATAATR
jgi:predicted negative regulator of RcsB-dependent stress response